MKIYITEVRAKMADAVITRYGFEAKETIYFCKCAEIRPIDEVKKLYKQLMEN